MYIHHHYHLFFLLHPSVLFELKFNGCSEPLLQLGALSIVLSTSVTDVSDRQGSVKLPRCLGPSECPRKFSLFLTHNPLWLLLLLAVPSSSRRAELRVLWVASGASEGWERVDLTPFRRWDRIWEESPWGRYSAATLKGIVPQLHKFVFKSLRKKTRQKASDPPSLAPVAAPICSVRQKPVSGSSETQHIRFLWSPPTLPWESPLMILYHFATVACWGKTADGRKCGKWSYTVYLMPKYNSPTPHQNKNTKHVVKNEDV